MFSLEKCRTLLGDIKSTDEEIEAIRESLYAIAELSIEAFILDKMSGSKNPIGLLSDIDADDTF